MKNVVTDSNLYITIVVSNKVTYYYFLWFIFLFTDDIHFGWKINKKACIQMLLLLLLVYYYCHTIIFCESKKNIHSHREHTWMFALVIKWKKKVFSTILWTFLFSYRNGSSESISIRAEEIFSLVRFEFKSTKIEKHTTQVYFSFYWNSGFIIKRSFGCSAT